MYHLDTREYRDKTYGNTYVSARLWLDYGDTYELIGVFPFQYGTASNIAYACEDITGERPKVHPATSLMKEAKLYGALSVEEAINLIPNRTPSHAVWLEVAHNAEYNDKKESAN